MKQMRWWSALIAALIVAGLSARPVAVRAEEELAVEEDAPEADTAPAAAPAPAAPAAKPASKPRAKARGVAGAAITKIDVVAVDGKTEIRVTGRGLPAARISKPRENWLAVDFAGARYAARKITLGPPGLGDIRMVRGAQNTGFARIVIELTKKVPYTEAASPAGYTLTFATQAIAGPDAADAEASSTPAAAAAGAAPFPAGIGATEVMDGGTGGRARVLHAMVSDMPDRARLVVTADGVLRYKLSSVAEGRELQLTMFDVDLKWSPPRLQLKDGPIAEVRAEQSAKPSPLVKVTIKLRAPRAYHVRRDQNQVILEVEKETEADVAAAETASRRGDLMHKVTLNVQNEDMPSLVKALAFEAGFDNVILPTVPSSQLVTLSLREVTFAKALNLILAPFALVWKVERGILRVNTETAFEAEIETVALSGGGSSDAGSSEEAGYVTRVFRLRNASLATNLVGTKSVVTQAVTDSILVKNPRTGVKEDPRTNSLIVSDVASNMPKIASIIRQLDIKVAQVMIQARLISLTKGSLNQVGISWEAERATPANPTVAGRAVGASAAFYTLRTGFLGPGFNVNATLDMLQTRGDIETLLNPSIATMHDQDATVKSEQTVQIVTQVITQGPGGIVSTPQLTSLSVPTTLKVRPHVNSDGTVSINVDISVVSITNQTIGALPDTSTQSAVTNLVVRNHETGVIGGILRDVKTVDVTKVPILGDLPWFLGGALFRSERATTSKQELVLFLSPIIQEDI